MTTNVILHIRGMPGTAARLLEAVHAIGSARASDPAFHGVAGPPDVTFADER